jgi:hypothetical protein
MACDRPQLVDYLANFSGQDPIDAVVCPFVQSSGGGAGMGMGVFGLFFIGFLGIGLTIRTQHPGPLVIALMLSAGLFATALPGIAVKIGALVLLFMITAVGFYLYQTAKGSL